MNDYLETAKNAGFDIRYAKEYANAHGYYPSMEELNDAMTSEFAYRLCAHFGIRDLKPGNLKDLCKTIENEELRRYLETFLS